MARYKKGEWVMYIKHYSRGLSLEREDKRYFQIGKIYQIYMVVNTNKSVYTILEVNGDYRQVTEDQIRKIPDTKLNRVLYPEAFGGNNE